MNPSESTLSSPLYQLLSSLDRTSSIPAILPQVTGPIENAFRAGPWPSPDTESDVEGELWSTWDTLLAVAMQSAHDGPEQRHQALVELLMQMRAQGPLKRRPQDGGNKKTGSAGGTEEGDVCTVWDMTAWQDLPVFGASVREEYNVDCDEPSESGPGVHYKYPNFNAFLARLTNSSYTSSWAKNPSASATSIANTPSPLDFYIYAIWALRDALEGKPAPQWQASSLPSSPLALHGASVWMTYAAPTVRRLSVEQMTVKTNAANPGDAVREKGWKGFSEERWNFWKEKFGEAARGLEEDGEKGGEGEGKGERRGDVKKAVEDALRKMNEAERA